eukprot:c8069_g1_i1.p1 GENE.c8069_g1_i1~~c8069_g1_i1.p1  ORF type:complete len:1191 (-),score=323.79 c8069_g1_i1:188-3760(-)
MASTTSANVRTIVRFRPPNSREIQLGYTDGSNGIEIVGSGTIHITPPAHKKLDEGETNEPKKFVVSRAFGMNTAQTDVFEAAAAEAVNDLFIGFNSTVFAYGQTGAGKSFTMFGSLSDPDSHGIIPRTVRRLFDKVLESPSDIEYTISCSYLEVYKEELFDLLSLDHKKKLNIRQSPQKGIFVENLHLEYVTSESDVYDCITVGNEQKKVGRTNMNAVSSRSHCVFTLYLRQQDTDGNSKQGKLNLVDLAGSEKVRKSGATGETLEEAKKINLSLTSLSQCINALSSGKNQHVPYRTSKLTRLLQESLGGNSKTTLVVNCSPSPDNCDETVATLRFAERCATIKNAVKANIHMSVEQLTEMVEALNNELSGLKQYASNMETRLRSLGVNVAELALEGHVEITAKLDVAVQFPENSRITQNDLKSTEPPDVLSPSLKNRQDAVKTIRLAFEAQGKASGAMPAGTVLAGVTLSWVSAKIVIVGLTKATFGDHERKVLTEAVWECVADEGVEQDDVFIADINQVKNCLVVNPVIVCDSPNVPQIVATLKSQISSGKLLAKIGVHSQAMQKAVLRIEDPLIQQKDSAFTEAAIRKEQNQRLVELVPQVLTTQEKTLTTEELKREIEIVERQRVEDQAELSALRSEIEKLRDENHGLNSQLSVKEVEMDTAKERLIAANTKLLQATERLKHKHLAPEEPAQPKPIQKHQLSPVLHHPSLQGANLGLPVPNPSKALTSRENDLDDDHNRKGLFGKFVGKKANGLKTGNSNLAPTLNVLNNNHNASEAKPIPHFVMHSSTIHTVPGAFEKQDSDSEPDIDISPAKGLRKPVPRNLEKPHQLGAIPGLSLSNMSSLNMTVVEELPSDKDLPGDEPIAPRKREDEELDDLLKKQEDLSKTVRRQQALIERQADALQQVGERVTQAEQEVQFLTQERDFLQERIGKLELKLYKHGLGQQQRRGSVKLERTVSQIAKTPGPNNDRTERAGFMDRPVSMAVSGSFSNTLATAPGPGVGGANGAGGVAPNGPQLERTISTRTALERSGMSGSGYDTFRTDSTGTHASLRISNIGAIPPATVVTTRPQSVIMQNPSFDPARVQLPSQRDIQYPQRTGRVLPSVREGPQIRKPVRDSKNSALTQARNEAPPNDSFMDLFKTPQFLSKLLLFDEDASDKEPGSAKEIPNDESPRKAPKSFWNFGAK